MKLFKSKPLKCVALLLVSSLTLSACTDSTFEKRVNETEEKNKTTETEVIPPVEELPAAEVEISEIQKEALEKAEIKDTAKEAVENSTLPVREEIEVVQIPEKSEYKNLEEFAQFTSALFYQFHSNQINGEVFYRTLSPHFSENFKSMLPKNETDQIETFQVLQKAFNAQLKFEIVKYQITNVEKQSRVEEASIYRKYTLSNGENIYFDTVFVKENDRWVLFDDSPSPPYITNAELEMNFKENKGE